MCSLKEHVFLVAGHKVASAIFFDGHCFLIVIKFYDDPKDLFVVKHQSNVRTNVNPFFLGLVIRVLVIRVLVDVILEFIVLFVGFIIFGFIFV